jgi:hypothetical protein
MAEFEEIIRRHGKALNGLWDEKSGYYFWTDRGKPLLYENRLNYNMGISGVYPLLAGEGDPSVRAKLVKHIAAEGEMGCPIGISTVDQSAPYYSPDGYWNGRVWMAHQWLIWKALLDIGEIDLAERVALTALETYSAAEKTTGHCFENFTIADKSGSGTRHFSALSAPVVNFYCAYFKPGRISTGFDVYISSRKDDRKGYPMEICLESPFTEGHQTGIVMMLDPCRNYEIDGRQWHAGPTGKVSLKVEINKRRKLGIDPR